MGLNSKPKWLNFMSKWLSSHPINDEFLEEGECYS